LSLILFYFLVFVAQLMPPLVSLILTVYNRDRHLSAAIESVLNQTYPNFELLIWDDGSTDRTASIAQHYAQHDRRIRLTCAPHRGRALSLQAAHAQAQGAYVGWIDSDDALAPTALAATVAVLEAHPTVGMVYTSYLVINSTNQVQQLGQRCQIPYSKERLLIDFMTFHFRLLRQSSYEQIGGIDNTLPCAMDYDLCLKLSEVTEIYHLSQPLYYYRHHSDTISYQQRLLQIECAQQAIENALVRRGLSDRIQLEVELVGRFRLRERL
jgi:glycosyltransferase involved in cell wall biosynthesis